MQGQKKKKKLKGDNVKRISAEFKKQVKNSCVVILWQTVVHGPNCHTELVKCKQYSGSMTTSAGNLFQ